MKLQKILDQIDDLQYKEVPEIQISGITEDSRKVKLNFIFFAIKGSASDGHLFIESAIKNGALVIIHEKELENYQENIFYIRSKNIRKVLALAAKNLYNDPSKNFSLIGITGTNGKTTISHIFYNSLRNLGKSAALIGTNHILLNDNTIEATHTTPGPVELNELLSKINEKNVEFVVMEVSSHSLDQSRVEGLSFDLAIFSNLTQDHLDYHGSMEEYAKAKRKLFEMLNENAIAITNLDDEYGSFMISNTKAQKFGLSSKSDAQYKIEKQSVKVEGNSFQLNGSKFTTKLIGEFNIYNSALSIAGLNKLGFGLKDLTDIMIDVDGAEGRMHIVPLKNGATAIVDYAHTPDGLEKALITSKKLVQEKGKLICVFGAGGDRDKTKRPIMGKVASDIADVAIVTSDNPRTEDPELIIDDIIRDNDNSFIREVDRSKAIKKAIELSNENDLILIAGKGHEKYQVLGKEKIYYSDFDEIEKFD